MNANQIDSARSRRHVVIVGGGFAGLRAARALSNVDVDVTLIDRRNHHLFQPLLYQVACAGLAATDIAVPLRHALRSVGNVRTLMAVVESADLKCRRVQLSDGSKIAYDYLILAAGAEPNYFGNDDWEPYAPSLKSLDAALRLRERILLAFERAEREPSRANRQRLLSFAVIGAGPTGVEMAGALAELGRLAIARDYRRVERADVRVTLIEMGDRVLPTFGTASSHAAQRMLEELGVEVRLRCKVDAVSDGLVMHAGGTQAASTICWASGVKPAGLASMMADQVPLNGQGRIAVKGDCSLEHYPEVFVLGDMACFRCHRRQRPLPALAAVAVQQGDAVGANIARDLRRRPRHAFEYHDRGIMATVGRGRAVADLGQLHLAGGGAWALWSLVHIYQLIGMRNRLRVLLDWAWQYLTTTRRPGARIITGREAAAEAALVDRHIDLARPDKAPSRLFHPQLPAVRHEVKGGHA